MKKNQNFSIKKRMGKMYSKNWNLQNDQLNDKIYKYSSNKNYRLNQKLTGNYTEKHNKSSSWNRKHEKMYRFESFKMGKKLFEMKFSSISIHKRRRMKTKRIQCDNLIFCCCLCLFARATDTQTSHKPMNSV